MNRKPPRWLFNTHGYDFTRWGDAIDQAYRVIIPWAREGKPRTYTELIKDIPALDWEKGAWEHHGSQVGDLLGHVSAHEWLDGRPLLSALVVLSENHQASNSPGEGFFRLARELNLPVAQTEMQRLEYWLAEIHACRKWWTEHPTDGVPDWRSHLAVPPSRSPASE